MVRGATEGAGLLKGVSTAVAEGLVAVGKVGGRQGVAGANWLEGRCRCRRTEPVGRAARPPGGSPPPPPRQAQAWTRGEVTCRGPRSACRARAHGLGLRGAGQTTDAVAVAVAVAVTAAAVGVGSQRVVAAVTARRTGSTIIAWRCCCR